MAAEPQQRPPYHPEFAKFNEIFDDPAHQRFTSYEIPGDPRPHDDNPVLFLGGVMIQSMGRDASGGELLVTRPVVDRGTNPLKSSTAFIEKYEHFYSRMATKPRIPGFQSFMARYQSEILTRSTAALRKKDRNVLGAFVLAESEPNKGDYMGLLLVSNILISKSQISASEAGLVAQGSTAANSLYGRITHYKPLSPVQYGQIVADTLLGQMLAPPKEIGRSMQQIQASNRWGRGLPTMRGGGHERDTRPAGRQRPRFMRRPN